MAWSPGWRATIRSTGPGGTGTAPGSKTAVLPDGTIQQVVIPGPGDYLVTFTYAPTSATVGLAVSAGAGAVLILWALYELLGAYRRRGRPGHPVGAPHPGPD